MLQDLLKNMSANSDTIGTIRNPIPNTEGKFTVDYSDGSSGIVGSTKICPTTAPGIANHCDYTGYQKLLFLKVN